ncbi:hypothetical protein ABS768_01780 [Flavobacterium sp. ST-75]|uniref:Uncharacterized protein n=1 Tax=Flavobacterium rhizophilum TaxID=3163296 RepID=A0ABW8YAF4_9FLAO
MNEDEFRELSSVSVEDETGFKYVKTTLGENKFKQVTTTTKNQVITKEDEEKIKAILKKY